MTEPRLSEYLAHILDAIARITNYVDGLDRDGFRADGRTQDAVIRNFGIIGEAAMESRPVLPGVFRGIISALLTRSLVGRVFLSGPTRFPTSRVRNDRISSEIETSGCSVCCPVAARARQATRLRDDNNITRRPRANLQLEHNQTTNSTSSTTVRAVMPALGGALPVRPAAALSR